MRLLTKSNRKTLLGESLGYRTFILHLAPHVLSGFNVCPGASRGCISGCLFTAGFGIYNNVQQARINRTKLFFGQRDAFMKYLVADIYSAMRQCDKEKLIPVFRLNGTSDIRWEREKVPTHKKSVMEIFSDLQWYDYTKLPNRRDIPDNYHLTFSRSEENDDAARRLLKQGKNVAVVFDTPKKQALPETWNGFKVIDGRTHDLRFLDEKGCVVGLSALGKARKDTSGFVVKL